MTIGIDARFFGPRSKGLGRYNQKLIENLEKIDNQNDYVIFLRQDEFDEYHPQNNRFKKVLADYCWYSLSEQIFMPWVIWREKVDLMHFPHFNIPVFYFSPYVVTIHDLILQYFSNQKDSLFLKLRYWLKNKAYRIIIRLALWRAKKIIAVSNYVKNDIIKCFRIAPEKIAVIYEGAPRITNHLESRNSLSVSPLLVEEGVGGGDLKHANNADICEYARENKNYPASVLPSTRGGKNANSQIQSPYLLYVGNAYPHKNLEKLVEAFILLNQKDLQLVLVGWDDYFYPQLIIRAESSILASMEDSARIIFTGFIGDEELDILYKNASLYVFPSLCEGFGLPPLEAMAHGVPVVSSSATCLPEILNDAALYFDPRSAPDIAQKISQVLNDNNLRQALVKKGFEQIKKYSWEKMARETLEVYSI